MQKQALSWFLVFGLAVALVMVLFSKCHSDTAVSNIQLKLDSSAKVTADAHANDSAYTVKLQDSISIVKAQLDSAKTASKVSELKHNEYRQQVKEKLNSLNLAIAKGDTAKQREASGDLGNTLQKTDDNIVQWQGLSNTKDSLMNELERIKDSLIASKGRTIDTLYKNNIGLQGLVAQALLENKPHGKVFGGFDIGISPGFSAIGLSGQYISKKDAAYQLTISYTTLKAPLYQFHWLSPITFKR